jgi:hypothetical protein
MKMTVKELAEYLQEYVNDGYGDHVMVFDDHQQEGMLQMVRIIGTTWGVMTEKGKFIKFTKRADGTYDRGMEIA